MGLRWGGGSEVGGEVDYKFFFFMKFIRKEFLEKRFFIWVLGMVRWGLRCFLEDLRSYELVRKIFCE